MGLQPEARDAVLAQWRGWMAADQVWFATEWHRSVALEALVRFADAQPGSEVSATLPSIEARSRVVPVGIDLQPMRDASPAGSEPPLVLWSHRWEPDKDPAAFVAAIDRLVQSDVEFRLALAGEHGDGGAPE